MSGLSFFHPEGNCSAMFAYLVERVLQDEKKGVLDGAGLFHPEGNFSATFAYLVERVLAG